MKRGNISSFWVCLFLMAAPLLAEMSLDSERLNLEVRMQQRVEEAISKIIPPGQFVVVVRVEPLAQFLQERAPLSEEDQFVLPGVPVKTRLDGMDAKFDNLIDNLQPKETGFQRFIKRVTVTIVLDKDIPDDVVSKVRELARQLVGVDAARGDTLDIQKTTFQKPVADPIITSNLFRLQKGVQTYALLIILVIVLFTILLFIFFVFGPFRGFLNKFVMTLSTMKPIPTDRYDRSSADQILPQIMAAQAMGYLPQGGGQGPGGGAVFSGSLQVENPNKRTTPFGFIREDHLENLAILLGRETPERAAVVLGYMPPEWISRVLNKMEPQFQSELADHLSTPRQLLPEEVEDIEQELKRRLDYLIGGPERIMAVYESLDPEAQRRMLDGMRVTRPDIADQIRQRALLFDDIAKWDAGSLKTLLREVERPVLVMALRGTPLELRDKFLEHMSEGKAQMIREELDLDESKPGRAVLEAQRKIANIARRLIHEGLIQPPAEPVHATDRFGTPSLISTIKLPPGLKVGTSDIVSAEAQIVPDKNVDIKERIRRFLNRREPRGPSGTSNSEPIE